MFDKQRDTGIPSEAKIAAEQRREGKFRQRLEAEAEQYDERNPPPVDVIPSCQMTLPQAGKAERA